MPGAVDPIYIAARATLLDALARVCDDLYLELFGRQTASMGWL